MDEESVEDEAIGGLADEEEPIEDDVLEEAVELELGQDDAVEEAVLDNILELAEEEPTDEDAEDKFEDEA